MTDLDGGSRVCAYHEEADEGVHIHHPIIGGDTQPTLIEDWQEDEAAVRLFGNQHDWPPYCGGF